MLTPEQKKRKKELKKELDFFLDNYKEISTRGQQIKEYFDLKIEQIIQELKELGK